MSDIVVELNAPHKGTTKNNLLKINKEKKMRVHLDSASKSKAPLYNQCQLFLIKHCIFMEI